MVKFTTSIITLALAASVAAAPAPTSQTTFSFAQWVEDIIANPDTALSPEEAVAAAQSAAVVTSAGGLSKRAAWCQDVLKSAPAGDATACLNDLARKGAQGITCNLAQDQSKVQMCQIGGARILSSKPERPPQGANCNDVARTGGLIFDSCYRADNTVKGSDQCITNPKFQVAIEGV